MRPQRGEQEEEEVHTRARSALSKQRIVTARQSARPLHAASAVPCAFLSAASAEPHVDKGWPKSSPSKWQRERT